MKCLAVGLRVRDNMFVVANAAQELSLLEQAAVAHPGARDEELVREISAQLIAEAQIEPPVNVEMVASMCGITSVEYAVQPWAGLLVPLKDRLIARVRLTDGHERQRFTVLHESGHTFLPGFGRKPEYRCNGEKTPEEMLCDLAAAELLFPRAFFVCDLRAARPGLAGVEDLARRYDASLQATALRAVDLASAPRLLMVFEVMHKPAERGSEADVEPKLRLAWAHGQGDWPYARQYKSVADDSPYARAFCGELVDEACQAGDVLATSAGELSVSARRYGNTVLALLGRERSRN